MVKYWGSHYAFDADTLVLIYKGIEMPINEGHIWEEITSARYYEFLWKDYSESIFNGVRLSVLFTSLLMVSYNIKDHKVQTDFQLFTENLTNYLHNDSDNVPYDVPDIELFAVSKALTYVIEAETFASILNKFELGNYMAVKTGHNNVLNKIHTYLLHNPASAGELSANKQVKKLTMSKGQKWTAEIKMFDRDAYFPPKKEKKTNVLEKATSTIASVIKTPINVLNKLNPLKKK